LASKITESGEREQEVKCEMIHDGGVIAVPVENTNNMNRIKNGRSW